MRKGKGYVLRCRHCLPSHATSGPIQVPSCCLPKLQNCHRSSICRDLLCVLALSTGWLQGVSSRRGAFFYLSLLTSPFLFPHYPEWIDFRIAAPLMLSLFIAMQKEATIRLHWEAFSSTGDTRYCISWDGEVTQLSGLQETKGRTNCFFSQTSLT